MAVCQTTNTEVYEANANAYIEGMYKGGAKLIVNQGGQGSSKTYSILQVIYGIAKTTPRSLKITLCSYALPHLKKGVMTDFERILTSRGENVGAIKSVSNKTYKVGMSLIDCYGVEGNVAMAHGIRRDILFINECNRKITYDVFDQLFTRTQGVTFIDFNPDAEFWLHEKVLPNFPHVLIKSSFIDNPYLPKHEYDNIMMKKDKPGFENWWRVYGLGELGRLEGIVFPNWEYGEFDTSLPYGYGLDFGYHPDPDTLVKVAIDKKKNVIYLKECFYMTNNNTNLLIEGVGKFCSRNDLIIADSASPRMIRELADKGFNVKAVQKYGGSVFEGIRLIQNYKLVVEDQSSNLAKELNNYIWNDKKAGIPIDAFNHAIDAFRYYVQTMLKPGGSSIIGISSS